MLIERGNPQQSDLDDIVIQIGQTFEKCAQKSFGYIKHGPKNHVTSTNNIGRPWFKDNCLRARNQYHKARRRYNVNKTEQNKQMLKHYSKYYKNTMNLSIKQFRTLRIQKLKNLRTTNPREYWKILNSSNPKSECQAPLQNLYEFFKNVNSSQENTFHSNMADSQIRSNVHEFEYTENKYLNRQISESEVGQAIKQLNNNKSAGVDNIKNEHIKCTSSIMIPLYTKLFNLIFYYSRMLVRWHY